MANKDSVSLDRNAILGAITESSRFGLGIDGRMGATQYETYTIEDWSNFVDTAFTIRNISVNILIRMFTLSQPERIAYIYLLDIDQIISESLASELSQYAILSDDSLQRLKEVFNQRGWFER